MTNFLDTSPQLTDADLDSVEKRFGFTFPRAFRTHYLTFNGGRPEKNRLVLDDGVCTVHQFLPIRYGRAKLLLEHDIQELKVNQHFIPEFLIPFAVDPGGDYYSFSTRETDEGAIFMFHMDHWKDPARATELLAASLEEFLARLKSKDEITKTGSVK